MGRVSRPVPARLTRGSVQRPVERAARLFRAGYPRTSPPRTIPPRAIPPGAVRRRFCTPRVLTNKAERLARLTVADAGLQAYFAPEAIIGCDTLAEAKPHPIGLHHLMNRFGAGRETTWMVGDSHTDVLVARRAVCTAIACSYGYGNAVHCQPDAVIHTPRDLLRLARAEW